MMTYLLSDIDFPSEFFSILFVDIDGKARALARDLFETEDRRVALYGPRGIGKSALLRGIGFWGLRSGAAKVPIVCKVREARSVANVADVEERFFTSVVQGIAAIPQIQKNWSRVTKKQLTARYAPWVADAVFGAAALFVQPLSMVSGVIGKAIESVVMPSSSRSLEELLMSQSVKTNRLSDLLISRLEESGIEPVFIIDELDKIIDPDIVHSFVEGNQNWFEGKNAILTISHNVGESLKKIASGSITRIASPVPYGGLSSTDQGREIVSRRVSLGLSLTYKLSEAKANSEFERVLPREAINEMIERTFPNPFHLLRLAYGTLETSVSTGNPVEKVLNAEASKPAVRITKQRLRILNAVNSGPLSLSDLSLKMKIDPRQLYVLLKSMVRIGLLHKTRDGRRVYYHMTEEGNRVIRLSSAN